MTNAINGGDAMNIEFERTRVNLWHIGAIVVSAVVNAFALGAIYTTMMNNDRDNAKAIEEVKAQQQRDIVDVRNAQEKEIAARIERGKLTDANFRTLFDKMPQFDLINQQILRLAEVAAENSKAIEETNKRIERGNDATNSKLDTIISRQAEQSSDIRVIQSQLAEQQKAQRTRFNALDAFLSRPKG